MCRRLISLVSFVLLLSVVSSTRADLVGYWSFDEGSGDTVFDMSGNGNDGTIVDNSLWDPEWISGVAGGAMEFYGVGGANGNGDYVEIESSDSLDITGETSIALWIRPDADDPEGQGTETAPMAKAMSGMSPSWSWQVRYGWGASEPYMAFTFNTSPRAWAFVGRSLERYEWVHISCSFDGATLTSYVNGEEAGSTPMGPITSSTCPVLIGSDGWGCDWLGAIDDVRIYDHALTHPEILGAMEGGIPPTAWGPEPEDGALYPDTWVTLRWSAGPYAVSHDVYIGDNYDAVNNDDVTGETFQGNQSSTYIVAGFPGFPYPDGLTPGTTYYWRIDEVNDADPNSPWKGPIWSFSIPPKTAYFPDPADGAEAVGPDNVILTWTGGYGAKLHTVFFGDDYDAVDAATTGAPSGTATYSAGSLEQEKVYYWRVDEFDGTDTYKGDIWSFTTPGAVGNPQPAYDAEDVQMNAILSWTASDSAASHQLYVGTDKEAVRTAGAGSPEAKGSVALGAETYDPGLLEANTTYYWRVDEIDAQGNTLKGPIWVFTTGSFLLVEDFESYTDNDADGEAIWQTWIDGFGVADNGAQVGYLMPPYAEQSTVHGGSQSMPLLYINEAGVSNSEATLMLAAQRDWTQAGVANLSIWFKGGSSNAAEPLYAAIANSAGAPGIVAHDDPGTVATSGWKQWLIPLQAFADQGINLTNVNELAIGLGTKSGAAGPGGTGTLFVDDITLNQ